MAGTLADFKTMLATVEDGEPFVDFCRKHVLHGTPFVFAGREDDFYEFRKRIAKKFGVSFHEVYITGSGRMGFSPFKDTEFGPDSDVDVAIVSQTLFDSFVEVIRDYQMNLRSARRTVTQPEQNMYHQFLEYTALGWIRPDKLPLSFRVRDFKNDWFEFFASLSNGNSEVGNYKVSGGVFRSYRHLELYTTSGIASVRDSLIIAKELNE